MNTSRPLEIHSDVWGPAPIPSPSHVLYYLIFVDVQIHMDILFANLMEIALILRVRKSVPYIVIEGDSIFHMALKLIYQRMG